MTETYFLIAFVVYIFGVSLSLLDPCRYGVSGIAVACLGMVWPFVLVLFMWWGAERAMKMVSRY